MTIRDAVAGDAVAACDVLRQSIATLCGADHGGDPARIAAWLANKTPERVAGWIADAANSVLVAVEDARIVGVGSVQDSGRIGLLYVAPEARFRGVSKALLAALEARAASRGCESCRLESTVTAQRFYLSAGYVPVEATEAESGGLPMARPLLDVTGRAGGGCC